MLYIVLTTGECNLKCKYCGGSFDPGVVPWRPQYDAGQLLDVVGSDPDPVIAFYGGEPLLNWRFVQDVVGLFSGRAKFVLQTNGLLIERVNPELLLKMDSILVSLDGVEDVTDKHRGRGVYRRALAGAKRLRSIGFAGDLIARMAVTEDTDIVRDVLHLLNLGLFDHVHWQLNAVWSDRWDLQGWADRSYLPGIRSLVDTWASEMERGNVLGIAPFQGILKRHVEGGPSPPCGAGETSIAISTDGRLLACPIAVSEGWAFMGRVDEGIGALGLGRWADEISGECGRCPFFKECGGRCLYSFKERLWGADGHSIICEVTRETIRAVLGVEGRVRDAVRAGAARWEDVLYPPYNNTVEIIP